MDKKIPKEKLVFYLSWTFFILSLVLVFISITNGIIDTHLFFNSDALHPATFYRAVFEDGFSFRSFKFPDAPYFFPDYLLFFGFLALTKSFLWSTILMAYTLFAFIFLGLYKLATYLIPNKHYYKKSLVLSGLSLMVILIAANKLFLHIFLLISPVFHEGELLTIVLSLIIIFELIRKKRWYLQLFLFILLTLITFADKSVVKDFTAPVFLTIIVFYFLNKEVFHKLSATLYILFISTVLGSFLYSFILPFPTHFPGLVSRSGENARRLFSDIFSFFTSTDFHVNIASKVYYFGNYLWFYSLIFITALVTMVTFLVRTYKKSIKNKQLNLYEKMFFAFGFYILTQIILDFIATIFFGYYNSLVHIRYFTVLFVFPYLWLLVYAGYALKEKYQLYIIATFLTAVVFAGVYLFTELQPGGMNNFLSYKPPNTECLDKIARENNLKYGLADLWNNVDSLFSQEGVRLHIAGAQGHYIIPSHWQSSYEWYIEKSPQDQTFPDYSFIMTERFNEDDIISTLGQPEKVYQCPQSKIFIYPPEVMKKAFEGMFKARFMFAQMDTVGDKIEIPASQFNSYIFDPSQKELPLVQSITTDSQKLIASAEEQGYLAVGPFITLKKGVYKVDLYYQGDRDKVGTVQIIISPPQLRHQAALNNTNGQTEVISGNLEVGKDMRKIDTNAYQAGVLRLVVNYSGEGSLVLDKLVVEKIN